MANVALIPARGGSKRIPRKNMKSFLGSPIIAYTIEAAINSGLFDQVIVSTDDSEIGNIAKSLGAVVPFTRPQKLSDDFATTTEVVNHAIDWMLENDIPVDNVCCMYATAPFIRKNDLVGAYHLFGNGLWKFVFTATEFSSSVYRGFEQLSTGGLKMSHPDCFSMRSQDLPKVYHDAAMFYWGTIDAWKSGLPIFSECSAPYIVPSWRVQDIDTHEDWKRAEFLYQMIQKDE